MNPRVLFVVNEAHFFLTHRRAVADLALAQGYEVHVAAPSDHVWARKGFSTKELSDRGYFVHEIGLSRRGLNPFHDFGTFISILRLYRRIRPALVHNITIKPVLYGGLAARILGVPALLHVTGMGHVYVADDLRTRIIRSGVSLFYRIVAAAPHSLLVVQNAGDLSALAAISRRSDIELVPGSGVDLESFPMVEEEAREVPIVVLPARLIWEKGIMTFVDAARLLREWEIPVDMVLVGDTQPSNPRSVPEQQLREWEAAGVVLWWGWRNDMANVLSRSNIVCLPSAYGEGVPKVLIEAAAVGRAIVASDIPGCREIVEPGANGLLVTPNDPQALASAIRQLIRDPATRREFGQSGRRKAENGFSELAMATKILSFYRRLIVSG